MLMPGVVYVIPHRHIDATLGCAEVDDGTSGKSEVSNPTVTSKKRWKLRAGMMIRAKTSLSEVFVEVGGILKNLGWFPRMVASDDLGMLHMNTSDYR